jgi:hypothetical protein
LGRDFLFPEWILANLLLYSFASGFSPHTFQASWMSPVFNPPEFLVVFKLPNRWTFAKFSMVLRVWRFENLIFCNWEGQSQPHGFIWHHTPCWCRDRREQTALAQVPEGAVVQKQPSLQPFCLIVSSFGQHVSCSRTYSRIM